ncbi:MAG: chromosomal replication initiator protein DnaA [Candidatus Azobacteroides pseudotrichonymphae]|jgi:chromosomal replication initiator protein|nr:chromosomal replication initiator protein DnaA [Bacteroidales bacterium OttesenSCG-928-I14]GMO33479.1 MAG: chromosomal replication initiator protein DnaA [Candidatus Azobacteroides pseudotrichonymphae]
MESHIRIWHQCLKIIEDNITENTFHTWFSPIVPLKYEDNNFTIQTPNQFFYEYLEEKYAKLILQSLFQVTGKQIILTYQIIINNDFDRNKKKYTTSQRDCSTSFNESQQTTLIKDWNSNLNNRQTFRNFFESDNNKVAYVIAQKVAQEPGKDFNPYFIYGGPGVGKTHLCHAIGNKVTEFHFQKRVIYIPAHLFQIQYTDSIRKHEPNEFIHFYQGIDILILDDIHELSGKEKTLQAYFHIFNHLHQLGRQIILTADKIPAEIIGLEERLTSRLKWGLTIELQKPDLELRKKILNYRIRQRRLSVPEEVIDYIAENVPENARDLEGIVTSLIAYSLVNNCEINLESAQKIVGKIVRKKKKQITLEKIQNIVSSYFKVNIDQIHSKSRKREIVQARQIAMFLSKKHTDHSYSLIGEQIGKRDRTTVLHACKSVQNNLDLSKRFRSTMRDIEVFLLN